MAMTHHVYEIFIHASPERVWEALRDPESTRQYFHGTHFESDFVDGAGYRNVLSDGTTAVEGTIEVCEPPSRLVMTWRVLYDTALSAEPPGRVEWRLRPANADGTVTRVTLRHGDLAMSPLTWEHVRLGWVEIIDGLKTLLETGGVMPPVDLSEPDGVDVDVDGDWHRSQAVAANNSVWELLDQPVDEPDVVDDLLARAYAAAYHWARASGRTPANAAHASWLLSRCHAVAGHGDLALHHARQTHATVMRADLDDFDLVYAHECLARAFALLGRRDDAVREVERARSVAIADPEDRAIVEADLASEPWFGVEI